MSTKEGLSEAEYLAGSTTEVVHLALFVDDQATVCKQPVDEHTVRGLSPLTGLLTVTCQACRAPVVDTTNRLLRHMESQP